MSGIRRSVSSLGALVTFEAAARLSSFTRAAAELGVTQAAVSRQIRLLEQEFNILLFRRAHRRVVLTPAGQVLAQTLTGAFGQVTDAIDAIRRPDAGDLVTVGATLGFSHFWLLPRLPQFRMAHPMVQIRMVSQDVGAEALRDGLDLLVHYGRAAPPGTRLLAELGDEVFPVCSPEFQARVAGREQMDLPLIGADWVEPSWLSWRRWSVLAGLDSPPARAPLRFSHYTDAVYAAIGGEGVVLGWQALISRHLADGRLVRLGERSVVPEERHILVCPVAHDPSGPAGSLAAWMIDAFAADP